MCSKQIGTEIYYPTPVHLQPCFLEMDQGSYSLPHTEKVANEVLSLPIFPELRADEQTRVVDAIHDFMSNRHANAA